MAMNCCLGVNVSQRCSTCSMDRVWPLSAGGGGQPTFSGNFWDHFAPTTRTAASGNNGDDVLYTQTVSTPTLDLSGASKFAGTCPPGRVPGP